VTWFTNVFTAKSSHPLGGAGQPVESPRSRGETEMTTAYVIVTVVGSFMAGVLGFTG